jgi:hypothetical protein
VSVALEPGVCQSLSSRFRVPVALEPGTKGRGRRPVGGQVRVWPGTVKFDAGFKFQVDDSMISGWASIKPARGSGSVPGSFKSWRHQVPQAFQLSSLAAASLSQVSRPPRPGTRAMPVPG